MIGAINIDDHRPGSLEKQDYLLAFRRRWIHVTMNGARGDMEEIARANGNDISTTRTSFETSNARNHVAIDIVVSVMVPA